jgi:adenylate cyclase
MRDPVVHEALRQLQDILAEETGAPVPPGARARMERVLRSALGPLAGTGPRENYLTREVTIVLADLRGFTALSASQPAPTVLRVLDRCFVEMSEIVYRHQGVIDKFMGDSILALFESGEPGEDGVAHALTCAVEMQCAMEGLNAAHRAAGLPELFFGIGINTGRVISARLGSELYSEYAVIGDEVNLASRIESFCLRGQVLVSESTFERCAGRFETGEPMDVFVKGRSDLVVLREVLGIPALGMRVPRQEMRRSHRVLAKLPFTFRKVARDAVLPESHAGRVLDIGYHGILAEVAQPVAPFSEICIDIELPLVGQTLRDLLGKVVKAAPHENRFRVGVEFSSMAPEHRAAVQLFVQLMIQGAESD